MKTESLLKFKAITSTFIIFGIIINIYTSILTIPVEFGVIILFLTVPSSIALFFLLFFIFLQKNFEKKSTILFSLFVGLIIPMIFSVIVYRELKIVLDPVRRQWRNVYKEGGVAPIKDGIWFYPNEENPWRILNFKNGKQNGKQIEYSSKDKLDKDFKFYNDGRIDSLSRYRRGKLIQTHYDFGLRDNDIIMKSYIYENEKMVKVVIHFDNAGNDTILIDN